MPNGGNGGGFTPAATAAGGMFLLSSEKCPKSVCTRRILKPLAKHCATAVHNTSGQRLAAILQIVQTIMTKDMQGVERKATFIFKKFISTEKNAEYLMFLKGRRSPDDPESAPRE